MIPVRTHAILDYVVGLLLILGPLLLGLPGMAAAVPMALGVATLVYSLLTDYDLGLFRVIPYRAHLMLDGAAGALLIVSPWFFGFWAVATWPHFIVGMTELLVVILSRHSTR